MKVEEKGKRAVVLGRGRSGRAAAALLAQLGVEAVTLEGADAFPAGEFAYVVVSPGIALSHPWIAAARAAAIPLMSELELGCRALRERGVKLLAVTGSKGKSSVVKIVADALNLADRRAVPCGNYGKPVSEVALEDGWEWAVVEVSSFMMETTNLPGHTFEAAAVLNLQEDHLDRHGDVATYHRLKRLLLTMTPTGYDYSQVPAGQDWSEGFWPRCLNRLFRMADASALQGSYFDNAILRTNGIAAAQLMYEAKVPFRAIRRAFREFVPLPHRMNLVAEIGGVRYIDDSKATSVAALVAGVTMAAGGRSVRLIAGGRAKGDDPKSANSILTERVKKVYIIGQCAEEFLSAWSAAADCEVCGTMGEAVRKAVHEAEKGETVLLSPGTASFDQFRSFEERGEVFAALVKKEGQER